MTSATVLDGVTVTGGNANGSYAPHDRGGGLYCDGVGHECSPMIQNTIFSGNAAALFGGAMLNNGSNGGTSSPQVVNATLTGNTAAYGGAIANSVGQDGISGDNGTSSPQITNATFTGNTADNSGGAIVNFVYTGESGTINPVITNTILWDNGDEVANSGATPQYSHSIIQGSGGSANWDGTLGTDNGNNLDAGPQFVNASDPDGPDDTFGTADDGLRVGLVSPALDAGDDSALPSGVTTDLAGASRVQNGTVDLGAYEGGRDGARIYHVDASAGNDSHTGLTWTQAVATLTQALHLATCNDEIWIAAGTYHPDQGPGVTEGDRTASFTITGAQDGLKIYGGFAGTETTLADRDLAAGNETILSGDIDQDGALSGNSYHVLVFDGGNGIGQNVGANVTTATVLDGVTVTGGNANGTFPNNSGGGLFCDAEGGSNVCSPTVANVVFEGNVASTRGGAIHNRAFGGESSPPIINSTFIDNVAERGGAIHNEGRTGTSSPPITNTTFIGNATEQNGYGGAIYNFGGNGTSNPTITNSMFHGNTSPTGSQIRNFGSGVDLTLSHTLTEGGAGGIANGGGASIIYLDADGNEGTGFAGSSNLDANPLFVDASAPAGPDGTFGTVDDGLLLQPGSPAVDAGDNSAIPSGVTTDLLGTDRIQDNDRDGTAQVSLGPYEALGLPQAATLSITGTDDSTPTGGGDAGWRLMGLPYATATAGDLRLDHAAGTTTPRFDLGVMYTWDDAGANGETPYTGAYVQSTAATSLESGQGFVFYLLDDTAAPVGTTPLTFSADRPMTALQGPAPVEQTLSPTARWHLLANPYATGYDLAALGSGGQSLPEAGFQSTVQIYDATSQSWQLVDAGTTVLSPWQGVFLERTSPGSGAASVTFAVEGRTESAPFVGTLGGAPAPADVQSASVPLRLVVTSGADTLAQDNAASIRFHENATLGWDAWDASKLDPLATTAATLAPVGRVRGDTLAAKAIESRPWLSPETGPVTVPLRLDATDDLAEHTLTLALADASVPGGWTLELTDTQGTTAPDDDVTVPLGAEMAYTAPVTPPGGATDTTRFHLTVRPDDALPVEMATFSGTRDDEAVQLKWQTASETHNAGFEVQRAAHVQTARRDGSPHSSNRESSAWESVGFVEGAGTTTEAQTYRFRDADLPYDADTLRYRLKQIDVDGTATLTEPVTVERAAVTTLALRGTFPNPARDRVTVQFAVPDASTERVTLRLYDLLGRRVREVVRDGTRGRTELHLSVGSLASGVYLLRLSVGDQTRTQKITVVQ